MKITENYMEKVYAGWLGKIIGIRLGAPIEGWTYQRIRDVFGEVWSYPADYKNFAADDDSNGPLFFIRALEDCEDSNNFSSKDVANALLNYVAAYIDDLYFDGKPDYRLDFGRMKLDSWHVTHQEVPQFAKLKGHSYLDGQYLSLSCADFAEMYTGHHLWNNYRVTAVLKPVTGTEHFVNIRVQGAMRSYAAGFSKNNKLVLRKNYYGYTTLCETDFEWKVDEEYKISLTADGSTISVSVNDKEYLKFTDSDLPLLTGCAGISVEKGSHCLYRDIAITGRE